MVALMEKNCSSRRQNQLTVVGITTQPTFTVGNPMPLPRRFLASRSLGGGAQADTTLLRTASDSSA